jgi:hypothetical protein
VLITETGDDVAFGGTGVEGCDVETSVGCP